MSESEITLEEAIKYMKEASEHEKSKQFNKFVESSIIILQYFAETGANLNILISVLVDITDEYLYTKNPRVLVEALSFFNKFIGDDE